MADLAEGAGVVARHALAEVAGGECAEDAADVVEDLGGALQQRVDAGAQLGDGAALAVQRDALGQVALHRRGGHLLRLFDRIAQHLVVAWTSAVTSVAILTIFTTRFISSLTGA